MRYLSLFSGIGGLDLGLDRAGLTCAAQVEQDPYRRSILAKNWEVPRHDDVRTFPRWWTRQGGGAVDVVAGGPPCQPVSHSGLNLGQGDPRWGWPWFLEGIDVVQARFVIFENVRGLLRHANLFGRILEDLSERGFDAEWSLVSACSVGAPHVRRRLFLVAHAAESGWPRGGLAESPEEAGRQELAGSGRWESEPGVGRVAHGIPDRMDRVAALGDAVVPGVAERVGRLILNAAAEK